MHDDGFVQCQNVQEMLLLQLIDRVERLERAIVEHNPLEDIDPKGCPSVLEDAKHIASRLNNKQDYSFDEETGFHKRTCPIMFQSNIDLLRRQGFTVEPLFRKPLPTDVFQVSWRE